MTLVFGVKSFHYLSKRALSYKTIDLIFVKELFTVLNDVVMIFIVKPIVV